LDRGEDRLADRGAGIRTAALDEVDQLGEGLLPSV
jgi:hypothetical protein